MATLENVRKAAGDFEAIGMPGHMWLRSGSNNFYTGLHAALQKGRVTEQQLIALGKHLERHAASDEKNLSQHVAKAEEIFNKTGSAMLAYRTLRETIRQRDLPIAKPWKSKLLLSAALAGLITGTAIGERIARHIVSKDRKPISALIVKHEPTTIVAPTKTKPMEVKPAKPVEQARPKTTPREETSATGELQREIAETITGLKKSGGLTADDAVSVLVHDLDNDETTVAINSGEEMMAASLIKPFVMLAAYHKISEGAAVPRGFENRMRAMVAQSNNRSMNKLLDFIGGVKEAAKIVRQYGFNNTHLVEYIPPDRRTYKNKTTAADLADFLRRVHRGELIT